MGSDLLQVCPPLQVKADHFKGSQGRLAPRPEMNEQAGYDGAVSLDLNADYIRAEQMAAAEHVLEEPKEQLDQPAMFVDVCDDFGRHIEQVRGNPQDPIAGGSRCAPRSE